MMIIENNNNTPLLNNRDVAFKRDFARCVDPRIQFRLPKKVNRGNQDHHPRTRMLYFPNDEIWVHRSSLERLFRLIPSSHIRFDLIE